MSSLDVTWGCLRSSWSRRFLIGPHQLYCPGSFTSTTSEPGFPPTGPLPLTMEPVPGAALAGCPLDSILPSPHARVASERVLRNQAAQSHLSIPTPVVPPFSYRGVISSRPSAPRRLAVLKDRGAGQTGQKCPRRSRM